MAEKISATEAVQVLQDHFGPTLNANHDDGIDQMAEVLKAQLGLKGGEAKEIVQDLERAHSIRFVQGDVASLPYPGTSNPPGAPVVGTGETATPWAGGGDGSSYWQLSR